MDPPQLAASSNKYVIEPFWKDWKISPSEDLLEEINDTLADGTYIFKITIDGILVQYQSKLH